MCYIIYIVDLVMKWYSNLGFNIDGFWICIKWKNVVKMGFMYGFIYNYKVEEFIEIKRFIVFGVRGRKWKVIVFIYLGLKK